MNPIPAPITAGAVVFVTDAARSSTFYAEVTGLAITHAEEGYVILESAGFQLVIHAIPAPIAATIEIATPPVLREDGAVKLFFVVPSLAEARAAAARLGGGLDPSEREWRLRNFRICEGYDPEGNVIQLREDTQPV